MISLRTLIRPTYFVRERIHGMRNISRVQFLTGYGHGNDGPTPQIENKGFATNDPNPHFEATADYKKKINSAGS